jgi:transposase
MNADLHSSSGAPVEEHELEFAAYVGIDWADQNSAWCLQAAGSDHRQSGEVSNQPEAIELWANTLLRQFSGRPIAVSIEQSHGRVVYQLAKFAHLVVFIVHPNKAAHFRTAVYPSGAKRDPVDAALLLDMLLHFRHGLHRLDPDTPETRLLGMLVEQRRKLVDDKTRYKNRLTNCLKLYFPQLLEWIDDIDSPMGCDWIARWPTLEALKHSHPGTLKTFFTQHNCRSAERIRTRIEQIYQARPATTDHAIITGNASEARHYVAIITALWVAIQELDQQIEELVAVHPETPLFAGLPGAGKALVPRLIVAFGTQRRRYRNVEHFLAYCGIAPVTVQSGKLRVVRWRFSCSKFLRQTFQEWAAHSIPRCPWARAFYQLQRSRNKRHFTAVRALAFKWVRILYRCWQTGTPYDEKIYLQSLARHNSPLLIAQPSGNTQLVWDTVAGFSKLKAKNA